MICSEVQQELYQSAVVMNNTIEHIDTTGVEVCPLLFFFRKLNVMMKIEDTTDLTNLCELLTGHL